MTTEAVHPASARPPAELLTELWCPFTRGKGVMQKMLFVIYNSHGLLKKMEARQGRVKLLCRKRGKYMGVGRVAVRLKLCGERPRGRDCVWLRRVEPGARLTGIW